MTLKEIATLAGVSVSTVSRVLNKNDEHASSNDTRNRILEIARKTGYVPNEAAQRLQRSDSLPASKRYVLSCVFARGKDPLSDPFFSEIFDSVQQESLRQKCIIVETSTVATFWDVEKVKQSTDCDGILILGRPSDAVLNKLRTFSKNIVYVSQNPIEANFDQVVCNGYNAAKMAVEYLHSLSHRKIAYIGEISAEVRYHGYYDTMQAFRLPIYRSYIVETPQSVEGGLAGAKKLLLDKENIPSAIFCADDLTAIGVMQAIKEALLSVPGDISVIGIDNIDLCETTVPMLTSIDTPKKELGKMAVKMLIDRIECGHRLPLKLEIPFRLCKRQSCVKYNK